MLCLQRWAFFWGGGCCTATAMTNDNKDYDDDDEEEEDDNGGEVMGGEGGAGGVQNQIHHCRHHCNKGGPHKVNGCRMLHCINGQWGGDEAFGKGGAQKSS